MIIDELLDLMWKDYVQISPASQVIHDLFVDEGNEVINDHIALRTFRHPRLGIDQMADVFKKMGYLEKDDYHFEKKKLYAKHYEWPDNSQPKIFISELKTEEFSTGLQQKVNAMVDQIQDSDLGREDFTCIGRPWQVSFEDYKSLVDESEYAGWLAAFGFRPNHFTVSVNHLKTFNDVQQINSFLKDKGHNLNSSGGEVKGTPEQHLEQSSTLAQQVNVKFVDQSATVASCYYEFAKRHPLASGELYHGFVATSADKIFESTDRQ